MAPLLLSHHHPCDHDYYAGSLLLPLEDGSSEHTAIEALQQQKKISKVIDLFESPFHHSAPLLDMDMLELFEKMVVESSQTAIKTVRFADYDEIHPIMHRSDMMPEDFDAMYMSAEEQLTARQEAQEELVAVNLGKLMEGNDECVCIRGLENHQLEQSQLYRDTVNRLYDIVYDCQKFEDMNDIPVPPEYLAEYMFPVSERCAVEARQRALQDQQEAARGR